MALTSDNIRNVMLAGHSGSGKTTLAEALLFQTNASDRFGSVADGNTVMDFDPEEIKRKASLYTATSPYDYKGVHVNLIDTPGLFDFALGMHEGVMAAETVMVVLSARSGVSVGTDKANQIAVKNKKARLLYVGQLCAEHADFPKTLAAVRESYGSAACPLVIPVQQEGKPNLYIDLLENKAYTYDKGKATEVPVPEGIADEYLHTISEAVAETEEELLDKFIMEEPFTKDELTRGIKTAIRNGSLAPVLAGDAIEQEAIDLLLRVINELLPSPADGEGVLATNKEGQEVKIPCSVSEPLCCYVFKTVADPFVGKLSYVKVLSGELTASSAIFNTRIGEQERIGKILSIKGKKQADATKVIAGDIGAITKLAETKTGDTLSDPSKPLTVAPIVLPNPTLTMAMSPKKKGDESKISGAIQRLIDEDGTLRYEMSTETGQLLLSGLGEQHLDVVQNKMKTKFGVDVDLKPPRLAFRETIRKKVKVQGRHKKQSGGHGQFGDVWIEFEPDAAADDLIFEEKIFGGAVPKNFFPAVEKGLRESIQRGVIAGYPVVGIKATLVDGSYHAVDSSEIAFKTAASLAFKDGMSKASPVLLEPILSVQAYVPDANMGDIMGEVTKRRGRILGMHSAEDGLQLVEAEVPEAEMSDFSTYIRSSTQGRGSFQVSFLRYEPLPANLEAKVVEETKALREAEE